MIVNFGRDGAFAVFGVSWCGCIGYGLVGKSARGSFKGCDGVDLLRHDLIEEMLARMLRFFQCLL